MSDAYTLTLSMVTLVGILAVLVLSGHYARKLAMEEGTDGRQ